MGGGRKALLLLFAAIFCGSVACARLANPVRQPSRQSKTPSPSPLQNASLTRQQDTPLPIMPTPPRQNAAWSHSADLLSSAAAALFAQGLADPRGLEYREIEIAVGNPWNGGGGNPVKTHGWILPGNNGERFAVAWNGLVYPVRSVGQPADLRGDWKAAGESKTGQTRLWAGVSESSAVQYGISEPLKLVLLLRLGETDLVRRLESAAPQSAKDPYLSLANDWAWNAFERAVAVHMRGDDRLALNDARMLTRIQPLAEAEAQRRGISTAGFNPRQPDRKSFYLPFLEQLPALLADSERRVSAMTRPLPAPNSIAALIDDLQNVDARQWGQPGGVSLAEDPRVQALVKRGGEAVEPLLNALENDSRLTRSVWFGRDFFRSRHLISVAEAAYAALSDFLQVSFKDYGEDGRPLTRKALAAQIRAYWGKMGGLPLAERFYLTLKDDKAGEKQWLEAVASIVQPTNVETHGLWTTIANPKPGQKIGLRGENLRDGRSPSVSQLLARRSDEIAAIRDNSSDEIFLYLDAGRLALYLADWDKAAALPILRKRLTRAWNIGVQPNDMLVWAGDPVENLGATVAKMTLACAACGDPAVYDDYAAWLQKSDLRHVSFGQGDLVKPLLQSAARPAVQRTFEFLFNDPKSPMSHIFAQINAGWQDQFFQSPLAKMAAFRRQALRGLANQSSAGFIVFNPRKDWNRMMEAEIYMSGNHFLYRGSDNDPDTPPPGQKRPFRVCDAYAYYYAQHQHGPQCQLFWPERKRDAAVAACRRWLKAED